MNEIIGDVVQELKEGRISALCHVCNDQGVMGSGIALQIKNEYPAAYAAYMEAYKDWEHGYEKSWLGEISFSSENNEQIVYNMVAQSGYGSGGRHLNYEALYVCLEQVRDDLLRRGKFKLGLPYKMGADRAGGNWDIVKKMIEVVFEDTDIEVTIVVFNK